MDDFAQFLTEIGLTQGQMDAAADSMPAPLANVGEPYAIGPSAIQGQGCFATLTHSGEIATLMDCGEWTEAGRYINHSDKPNTVAVRKGNKVIVSGNVNAGDEITLNYRQVKSCIFGGV